MKNKKALTSYLLVILVYVLITILNGAGSLSSTMNALLVPTVAYIVAALALNLLVGYLGDLCLGQAGFMAVGALSAAFTPLKNHSGAFFKSPSVTCSTVFDFCVLPPAAP